MISSLNIPGSCYPVEPLPGNVTIKLAGPIVVDSVTIDHIHKQINWYDARTVPRHVSVFVRKL